ncbi:unnamed protein product [Laminaria digitata]
MVDVGRKRCLTASCTGRAIFNCVGSKISSFCWRHAEHAMVDVRLKCARDSCGKCPTFNVEGSKQPAFCKEHAADGMVTIGMNRCSHDACMTRPSYNVRGSKGPTFCKKHAEDGMVNVSRKRRSSAERVQTRVLDGNDGEAAAKRGRQALPETLSPPV